MWFLFLESIKTEESRQLLAALYCEIYPLLRKKVIDITLEPDSADDIVQQTVLQVAKHIDVLKLKSKATLVAYIKKAAVNTAKNYLISRSRENRHRYLGALEDIAETLPDVEFSMEDIIQRGGDYEGLSRALERLNERDQHLLICKYIMEMKDEEIAEKLGVRRENLRAYYSRARERLRKLLAEEREGRCDRAQR